MALSHNCLLRGLNAILQQGPHVPSFSDPNYKAQDVKDFLFYVASWVKTVEWHHHTEETCMFPGIEAFSGQPGLLQGSKEQHEEFTPGLERLLEYAQHTDPAEYIWEGNGGMQKIIDGFTASLTNHLYEEIDVFLGMGNLDSKGLRKCWDDAEEVAKAKGKFYMLVRLRDLSPVCETKKSHDARANANRRNMFSMMSSLVFSAAAIKLSKEGINFLLYRRYCHMSSNTGSEPKIPVHGDSTHATSGESLCR
ncbi:MAG: hypothetical protein Q9227_000186 [Pyrenula ochraceoflavens]